MKIAYLMPNLHVTGGARVAVELSNRLVERGHQVFILIPRGRNKLQIECRAEVVECGVAVGNPLLAVPAGMLGMALELPDVDLLVASMPPYVFVAQLLAWLRSRRAVNYLLNDDVHFFDDRTFIRNPMLLSLYRAVARLSIRRPPLLTNSHWTAVQSVREGGARPLAIIPHGYDPEVFHPAGRREREGGAVRLVTIGRRARWKGFADLVKGLNIACDEGAPPFELTVITQDDLDLQQARFPVETVKPVGDRELADHYRRGDIYIHSSWFEGFGIPPLEAQACGLAVISTDCGGVREFLKDGENALIVPPREPATLARVVRRMLEDGSLRNRLVAAGGESCREFTWDRVADRFEAALVAVVRGEQ